MFLARTRCCVEKQFEHLALLLFDLRRLPPDEDESRLINPQTTQKIGLTSND